MTKENEVQIVTIEDVLEELSYSWSQPEADDFNNKFKNKDYSSAKKMLKNEGFSEEKIKMVMDYFKEKLDAKKKLVEYFSFEYEHLNEDDNLLIAYGGTIIATQINKNEKYTYRKESCFYDSRGGFIPLSNATQVWKVVTI